MNHLLGLNGNYFLTQALSLKYQQGAENQKGYQGTNIGFLSALPIYF